jgi:signal transduction histidine kinase
VLVNLLENAIKFSPGGGTITEKVQLGPRPDGRGTQATMAVSDQGIGIASTDLPHVFNRFFQRSDAMVLKGEPSVGMGLSIARGIVEQHGGTMWVTSTVGTGSTFYLTLPVRTGALFDPVEGNPPVRAHKVESAVGNGRS